LIMNEWGKHKLEIAKEKLLKRLPIEAVRKLPKYSNITREEYLLLINRLEEIGLMLLKSYIFHKNDTT